MDSAGKGETVRRNAHFTPVRPASAYGLNTAVIGEAHYMTARESPWREETLGFRLLAYVTFTLLSVAIFVAAVALVV